MTNKRIIIFLHANDTHHVDWVLLAEDNRVAEIKMHGNLEELAVLTQNLDVDVIVPAEDVLLTSAALPKLKRKELQQTLPFALEEQLIDDVTQLHFAVGPYQTDNTFPVAVVAKAKMQLWVDTLKALNIEPMSMIPAQLAFPFEEEQWSIYSNENTFIIRSGKYSGFVADKENLERILIFAQKHAQAILPLDKTAVEKIALTLPTLPYINLLQGPYPAKRKTTRTKNVWKYAAYVGGAWILCAFISNIISFLILHHQAAKIDTAIADIYYYHFPHASSIVAPRERMETKLKEITNTTQKNNFLILLATVGKALSQTSHIRLQHLDYRSGQLTLELSSSNFDNLDTLTHKLNQQGLSVKQQNAATVGSQVKATLLISAGMS